MKKRFFPIVMLIFFEGVADYFATKWGTEQKLFLAIIAIGFYVVCNIFRLFALKNGVGLGKGNIIFAVGSSIVAISMGFLLFNETYSNIQIIGLLLGLVSLVLVNIETT